MVGVVDVGGRRTRRPRSVARPAPCPTVAGTRSSRSWVSDSVGLLGAAGRTAWRRRAPSTVPSAETSMSGRRRRSAGEQRVARVPAASSVSAALRRRRAARPATPDDHGVRRAGARERRGQPVVRLHRGDRARQVLHARAARAACPAPARRARAGRAPDQQGAAGPAQRRAAAAGQTAGPAAGVVGRSAATAPACAAGRPSGPSLASSAGSTVSEPSTATGTTRIEPTARDEKTTSPARNSPAIAIDHRDAGDDHRVAGGLGGDLDRVEVPAALRRVPRARGAGRTASSRRRRPCRSAG